jgi:hypothetical protein
VSDGVVTLLTGTPTTTPFYLERGGIP